MWNTKKLRSLKVIVFDIGNTLVDLREVVSVCARRACRELAQIEPAYDAQLLLQSYIRASARLHHPHINRLFSDRMIISEAMLLAHQPPTERAVLIFLTYYRKELRTLIRRRSDLLDCFGVLKERGYQLASISDGTTIEQYELLELLGVLGMLDYVLVSESFGEEKVSPGIFRALLGHFQIPPAAAAMVGDDLERDMCWAHHTGMVTIWQTQYHLHPPNVQGGLPDAVDVSLSRIDDLLELMPPVRKKSPDG
jgi:FMN phosphatase YigB (HAD superfamily)